MKKQLISILALFFLAATAYCALTSSTILLEANGTIKPFSTMRINLDALVKTAEYSVFCTLINENTEGVDIRLDMDMQSGTWIAFYLNDKKLSPLQGTLRPGSNTSRSDVVSASNGNYVTFVNLDRQNSIKINNCFAKPIIG